MGIVKGDSNEYPANFTSVSNYHQVKTQSSLLDKCTKTQFKWDFQLLRNTNWYYGIIKWFAEVCMNTISIPAMNYNYRCLSKNASIFGYKGLELTVQTLIMLLLGVFDRKYTDLQYFSTFFGCTGIKLNIYSNVLFRKSYSFKKS